MMKFRHPTATPARRRSRATHPHMSEPILSQRVVPAGAAATLERQRYLRQLVDDHRRYAWDLMAEP
eukprot:COSAG03_NODE_18711_length_350_cov_0.537849_1_plen_65_part_01